MTQPHKRTSPLATSTPFDLETHGDILLAILKEMQAASRQSDRTLTRILRRHPLPNGKLMSKSQLMDGYAQWCEREEQTSIHGLSALRS